MKYVSKGWLALLLLVGSSAHAQSSASWFDERTETLQFQEWASRMLQITGHGNVYELRVDGNYVQASFQGLSANHAVREYQLEWFVPQSSATTMTCPGRSDRRPFCIQPDRRLIRISAQAWQELRGRPRAMSEFVYRIYFEIAGATPDEVSRFAHYARLVGEQFLSFYPREADAAVGGRRALVDTAWPRIAPRSGRDAISHLRVGVGVGGGARLAETSTSGMRIDGVGSLSITAEGAFVRPLDAEGGWIGSGGAIRLRGAVDAGDVGGGGVPIFNVALDGHAAAFPAIAGLWVGVRATHAPQMSQFLFHAGLTALNLPFRINGNDYVLFQVSVAPITGWWRETRAALPVPPRASGDVAWAVNGSLVAEVGEFYVSIQGTYDRSVNDPIEQVELAAALSIPLNLIFPNDAVRIEAEASHLWTSTGTADGAVTTGTGRVLYEARF